MTPGTRIIHPEFGDCTAEIIEELLELAQFKNPVILEREQAMMAAEAGQVAQDMACGRLVAEIHAEVWDEMQATHGKEFFSKRKGGDGLEYMLKHFPACRIDSRGKNATTRVDAIASANRQAAEKNKRRFAVTSKRGRGRWALNAA